MALVDQNCQKLEPWVKTSPLISSEQQRAGVCGGGGGGHDNQQMLARPLRGYIELGARGGGIKLEGKFVPIEIFREHD